MKCIALVILFFYFLINAKIAFAETSLNKKLSGRILLQTQKNGEAWYVNPDNLQRYYLGRPTDAFNIMRELGLGISDTNFENFSNNVPKRLSGKILIKIEDLGKAYYIHPIDLSFNYLGRPKDAFELMRKFGLGITNENIVKILIHKPINQKKLIAHNVPFTSQAPFAEWNNEIFQDGCEEASIIMAMAWVNNETLTKKESKQKIIDLATYQKNNLSGHKDRSAHDSAELIKKYYKYNNIEYIENVKIDDIIKELEKENIVVAPMNGQNLKNIYFNPPGPINHMILIIGYDYINEEFITNDPGTRRGKNYKYSKKIIKNALRDYPTGYHEINNKIKKNIIVIKKAD